MTKLFGNNELKAKGDYSELSEIRDFIRSRAFASGLDTEKIDKIILAVDEACSNLIHYSMKFNHRENITIECFNKKDTFTVIIKDNGTPFDPNKNPSPDMSEYFKKCKSGGLGIHIIKQIVDKIEYLPSDSSDPSNKLLLTMCSK